jgi:hypothetical protein
MWIVNPLQPQPAKQIDRSQLDGSDLQELVVGNDVKIRDSNVPTASSESWRWRTILLSPNWQNRLFICMNDMLTLYHSFKKIRLTMSKNA